MPALALQQKPVAQGAPKAATTSRSVVHEEEPQHNTRSLARGGTSIAAPPPNNRGTLRPFGHSIQHLPAFSPAPLSIQPKLKINQPGDQFEQEADKVADMVMRMPEPTVQRKCSCGGSCSACKHAHSPARSDGSVGSGRSQPFAQEGITLPSGPGYIPFPHTVPCSGTCTLGTSSTQCFPGVSGSTVLIANDCCTRPCTVEHENIHVKDLNDCCKAYQATVKAKGDTPAIHQTWLGWVESMRPFTECKAHTNDVVCAQGMAREKECGRDADLSIQADQEGDLAESMLATEGAASGEREIAQPALAGDHNATEVNNSQNACCQDIACYEHAFKEKADKACAEAKGKAMRKCPFPK